MSHRSPKKSAPGRRFTARFIRRLSSWLALSTVLTVGASYRAQSAQQTWNPGNSIWNNSAANWDAGSVWTNGNTAIFNTSLFESVNAASGTSAGGLEFDATGYTIAGTLALDGGATIVVNSSATISAVLTNGTSPTGVTISGPGILTYTGANTYNASTTVTSGELDLNTTTGNALNGGLIVAGGTVKLLHAAEIADSATVSVSAGTFDIGVFSETVAGVQLTGGSITNTTGTLTSTTAYDVQAGSISAILAGAVGLTKSGNGTVTLSGANTFTGAVSITGGVLSVAASNNLGSAAATNTIALSGGGTLQSTGATVTLASPRTVTLGTGGGVFDVTGANLLTISALISGSNALTKVGTGKLILSNGNNSFSSLVIKAGTVQGSQNTAGQLTSLGTGTVTLGDTGGSAAATLELQGSFPTFANPIVLGGTSGALSINAVNSGTAETLSGGITGGNNVSLSNGANTTTFSITTGALNNAGTITNNSPTATGSIAISSAVGPNVTGLIQNSTTSATTVSGLLTVNSLGTTLTNTSGTKLLSITAGVSGTGDLILQNNSATANGVSVTTVSVNNTGAITNVGTGTGVALVSAPIGSNVTAINANSNTSPLTISGAITLAGNTLTINSNNTNTTTATTIGAGAITGTGNVVLNANSTNAITVSATSPTGIIGTYTNSGTGAGSVTISGVIGTSVLGVIQNSATSALILGGANTFTGGLTIKKGSAIANVSNATTVSGAAGPSTVAIALGDTGGSSAASLLANAGITVSNSINLGATSGVLTVGNNAGTTAAIFSGNIALNGHDLTVTTTGTTGSTTLSGALISGTGNLILNATNTTAGTGITVSATNVNNTGNITNSSGSGAGNALISGAIGSSVVNVTQNSSFSNLTLSSATNTYSGVTTVSAGTLTASGATNFNGGAASGPLGTSTSAATSLIIDGGTFAYGGATGGTTDRLFTLTANGGGVTNAAASNGTLIFTNTAAITASGTGNRTLNLADTGTGFFTFTPLIVDPTGGGATTVNINGTATGSTVVLLPGASNSFTGGVTITSRTLQVQTANGLGANTVAFGTGTSPILDLRSNTAVNFTTNGGGNVVFGSNSGTISLSAVSASNAVTHTIGNISIGTATMTIAHGSNLNTNNSDSLTLGTLTLTGNPTITINNGNGSAVPLDTFGALNDGGVARTVTVGGGAGTAGSGPRLVLGTTAAVFTPGTTLVVNTNTSGAVRLTTADAFSDGIAADAVISFGATGTGTLQLLNNAATTFDNNIVVNNSGTITIGAASLSNAITQTAGTLSIGNATLTITTANSNTNTANSLVLGATTLTGNATFAANNVNGTGIGSLTLGALDDGGNARAVTKSGAGTLVLNTAATSFGGTSSLAVSNGIVQLGNSSALGSGSISVTSTGEVVLNAATTFSNNITIAATGVAGLGVLRGPTAAGVAAVYNGTLTVNSNTSAGGTIDGGSGAGSSLTLAGPIVVGPATTVFGQRVGTVNYNAPFTFSGGNNLTSFVLSVGTANWGVDNVLPSNVSVVVAGSGNATFALNGFNQSINGLTLGSSSAPASVATVTTGASTLTLTGTLANDPASTATQLVTGKLSLGGGTSVFNIDSGAAGSDVTISAAISNGAINKTGVGVLTLSGANTYTGGTSVLNGTVILAASYGSANIGAVTVGDTGGTNGATLTQSGGTVYSGPVTVAANATAGLLTVGGTNSFNTAWYTGSLAVNNNVTLTSTNAGAVTNFSGPISGTGSNTITIAGAGTVIFSGNDAGLQGTISISSGSTLRFLPTATAPVATIMVNGFLVNSGLLPLNVSSLSAGAELLVANDSFNRDYTSTPNLSLGALGAYTYSGTMTPGANGYNFGGGGGTLTVSSMLTGPNALNINPNGLTGIVVLTNAANNYTGQTNVNAGTLSFLTNTLGAANTAAVVVGNGTLQWGASTTTDLSSRLTLVDGATAVLDTNGNAVSFANAIGNNLSAAPSTGNVTKFGAGTLTLTAPVNYTGTTTLANGGLTTTAGGAGSVPLGSGNVVITGGTLTFAPANSGVDTTASIATGSGRTLTIGAANGGGATILLTRNGSNNLTVTAGPSGAPSTSLARPGKGSLTIAATSALAASPTLGNSEIFLVNGETNTAAGSIYSPFVIAQDNSGASGAAVGSFVTYDSVAGFRALEAAASVTTYTAYNSGAANTFTATQIADITGAAAFNTSSVGAIRVSGAAMTINATNTVTLGSGVVGIILNPTATQAKITGTGTLALGSTSTELQIYVGSGAGNALIDTMAASNAANTIVKTGPGTLLFGSGAAVGTGFLGSLVINGGTFQLNASTSDTYKFPSITINAGGTFKYGGSVNTLTNSSVITINAGGTLNYNNQGDTIGAIQGAGTIIATGSNQTMSAFNGKVFSGTISGAGNWIYTGAADTDTMTLSGSLANTYTGNTTLNRGVLLLSKTPGVNAVGGNVLITPATATAATVRLTGDNEIADTGVVTVKATGTGTATLDLSNYNETIAGLSDGGSTALATSIVNLGSAQLTLTAASGANTFGGNILGVGGTLLKLGASTQVLGGANTFAGNTTIGSANGATGGILQATTNNNNLGSAALTVYGGTADITTTTQFFTSVSLGGGAAATTASMNISAGGVLNLGGNIAYSATNNPLGATITGTGTINLNAPRTFTVDSSTASAGIDLSIASNIADGTGSNSLTKAGAGVLVLGGANTYSGGTTVNLGTVQLTGSIAGNTALTVKGGAGFSLISGVANPVGTVSVLSLGTGSGTTSISFDLGASTATSDFIATPNSATTANTIALYLSALPGFGSSSTYNLITALSGLSGATYSLNSAPGGYVYSLSASTDSVVRLSLTPATGNLYWRGAINTSWSSFNAGLSNFTTDLAGATNAHAAPGIGSSVIFSATGATGPTLATTLDTSFSIQDLTFNANVPAITAITIASGAGTNALTITPVASTAGINLAAGGPASVGISVGVVLGADQTWTVADASTVLAVSGPITGTANFTKAGNGILALSGISSYVGTTTVSGGVLRSDTANAFNSASAFTIGAGGTLRLNGVADSLLSLAGVSGAIVENGSASSSAVLTVGSSASTNFGGAIQNGGAATLGVTKVGNGTLDLSGASTFTGNLTVSAGTLNISGSWLGNSTTTAFNYGGSPVNTIVNVTGDINGFTMSGGTVVGAVAVYNQTAGNVVFNRSGNNDTIQVSTVGYGYFNLTGGTVTSNGRFVVNSGAGTGVFYIGGTGSLLVKDYFLQAFNGTGAIGETTIGPGGSVTHNGADQVGITWSSSGVYGVFNVAGGSLTMTTGVLEFGSTSGTGTGVLNVDAGTIILNSGIATLITTGSANNYINFAGGTLTTSAASATLLPTAAGAGTMTSTVFGAINNSSSSAINAALGTTQDFAGGLKVNTSGFNSTITAALLGASGSGVAQSSLNVIGGSGYIGAPMVQFIGGTLAPNGTPATGYALISGGAVIGIVITNPGEYTTGPTSVTLTGGGGTGASVSIITLVANGGTGGLTKLGSGTLTLSNANNSYAGGNTVGTAGGSNAGTLAATANGAFGVAAPLTVFGGTADITTTTQSITTLALGGGAAGSSAAINIGTGGVLNLGGNVTFSATNNPNGASISGTGTLNLNADRIFTVASSTGGSNQTLSVPDLLVGAIVADGAGGPHAMTLSGNGWLNLSNAANTFSGAIAINAGTGQLQLASSGTTPSITIAGGLSSATSPTLNFSTQNPAVGTAYTTGALSLGNNSNLTFTLGASANSTNPLLTVTGAITLPAAGNRVTINLTKGAAFDVGVASVTYTLISAPSSSLAGSSTSSFILGNTPGGYVFSLSDTSSSLLVSALQYNGPLYWMGNFGGGDTTWTTTAPGAAIQSNWTSDAAGTSTIAAVPGINNDVTFSATGATNSAASIVDADMTVKTLTVTDPAATLIIGAGPTNSSLAFGGSGAVLTVNNGAGGLVLGSSTAGQELPIVLGATAQTFSNTSSGLLDIKNGVSATTGATILTLSGTGNIIIEGGVANGTATSLGIAKTGADTVTLSGLSATAASNYSGPTTLDGGTLAIPGTVALTGALTFGAAAGSVNISTLDLSGGSLTLNGVLTSQTNSATANTITIGSGKTLTAAGGLTVGYNNPAATTVPSKLAVSGGGVFAVTGTTFQVGVAASVQGDNDTGTLDLSGLTGPGGGTPAFTANVTNFNLGPGQSSSGIVILSNGGNSITATTFQVGASGASNSGAVGSSLTLGSGSNVIKADTINLATGKANGTISFASSAAGSGTITITNKAGNGGANLLLGSPISNTAAVPTGILDLRGHNSTVTAGSVSLGISNTTGTGGGIGTILFDTGTFTANSLIMGTKSSTGSATSVGEIDLSGGSFIVNSAGSVTMGSNTGSGGATALLNITGGAFTVGSGSTFAMATTTSTGSATATISITGGTLTSNADITKGGGTGATTATVTLDGGTLDMTGHALGGATAIDNVNLRSGTLKNVSQINNGAAVTKTTNGTLTISGTNGYTGLTNVSAGEVVVEGSLAGDVSVSAGATLTSAHNLTAQVGAITTASVNGTGSVVDPGGMSGSGLSSIGRLTANGNVALGSAATTPERTHLKLEIGGAGSAANAGTTYDQLDVTGASRSVSLTNVNLDLSLVNGFSSFTGATFNTGTNQFNLDGDKYFILTLAASNSSLGGTTFANQGAVDPNLLGFNTITLGGQVFAISYTADFGNNSFTGGNDVAIMAIPEPNSLAMVAAGIGMALGMQRFRGRRVEGKEVPGA